MASSESPEGKKITSPCAILQPPNFEESRTIVALGCSRGGTSMLAGALRILGVPMGHIVGPNHEDVDFITEDTARLRGLIAERNAEHAVWGWKYPHTIDYLDEILPSLRHPHFIVIFRNLFSVAQSFQKYHPDTSFSVALEEAHRRYAKLVRFVSRCTHPLLVCSYEQALKEKSAFAVQLAAFIGMGEDSAVQERTARFMDESRGYTKIEQV